MVFNYHGLADFFATETVLYNYLYTRLLNLPWQSEDPGKSTGSDTEKSTSAVT